ncbi:hypothetical protein L1987_54792 [Smallanthus sonchifolius]|uniref:Uncharacterized protein n=1 Tax=Smallanthus sonchifolius TaxID=185202 RepID=A0ACB9E8K7_9ASTR|nr:hypothetical protein L1987_54792 [Smallanthus sonchifolius]
MARESDDINVSMDSVIMCAMVCLHSVYCCCAPNPTGNGGVSDSSEDSVSLPSDRSACCSGHSPSVATGNDDVMQMMCSSSEECDMDVVIMLAMQYMYGYHVYRDSMHVLSVQPVPKRPEKHVRKSVNMRLLAYVHVLLKRSQPKLTVCVCMPPARSINSGKCG